MLIKNSWWISNIYWEKLLVYVWEAGS